MLNGISTPMDSVHALIYMYKNKKHRLLTTYSIVLYSPLAEIVSDEAVGPGPSQ